LYFRFIKKIESVHVLNYLSYNKQEVKELISEKLNWIDYGGKHYESLFTKFYQAYILPVKFGIDKRKAHLSSLIVSGQISRAMAFEEIKKSFYENESVFKSEKQYVLKKLGLKEKELDEYMKGPIRMHTDFKTEKKFWEVYFKILKISKFWNKIKA